MAKDDKKASKETPLEPPPEPPADEPQTPPEQPADAPPVHPEPPAPARYRLKRGQGKLRLQLTPTSVVRRIVATDVVELSAEELRRFGHRFERVE